MQNPDMSVVNIVLIIFGAACNIGAAGLVVRWLLAKVDKHNELLPKIGTQLEATTETQKIISESIGELFNSRNDLDKRVVRVETIITNNGCDTKGKRGEG